MQGGPGADQQNQQMNGEAPAGAPGAPTGDNGEPVAFFQPSGGGGGQQGPMLGPDGQPLRKRRRRRRRGRGGRNREWRAQGPDGAAPADGDGGGDGGGGGGGDAGGELSDGDAT